MGYSRKANQFPAPAAITRKAESETIRCFQIAFGIETDRGNGTTTRGAPEEEYVREFSGSHYTSTVKGYEGDGHSISRIGRTFLLKMGRRASIGRSSKPTYQIPVSFGRGILTEACL